MQKANNRIACIDELKGIGIILVVGNIMLFSFGFSHSSVVNTLAIFHMPLFVFISGYLTFKQNKQTVYCIHYFFISDVSDWIYPYLNVPNGFFIQFICSINICCRNHCSLFGY